MRELQFVEGLRHRARGRVGEDVGHPLGQLLAEHGVVLRRAERGQHDENLVAVDELVGGLHGARRLILVIFHHELDLAAVDALLVGFIEAQARALSGADAPRAHGAAQRRVTADDDLGRRHAILGERRYGDAARKDRDQRQLCQSPHVHLPPL